VGYLVVDFLNFGRKDWKEKIRLHLTNLNRFESGFCKPSPTKRVDHAKTK
jgi:hypothetical protein